MFVAVRIFPQNNQYTSTADVEDFIVYLSFWVYHGGWINPVICVRKPYSTV
jgi:hypothetical protein